MFIVSTTSLATTLCVFLDSRGREHAHVSSLHGAHCNSSPHGQHLVQTQDRRLLPGPSSWVVPRSSRGGPPLSLSLFSPERTRPTLQSGFMHDAPGWSPPPGMSWQRCHGLSRASPGLARPTCTATARAARSSLLRLRRGERYAVRAVRQVEARLLKTCLRFDTWKIFSMTLLLLATLAGSSHFLVCFCPSLSKNSVRSTRVRLLPC